ncbi:MAG: hypothetical protein RM368_06550 [Nostoc sp. DedSLP03]|uniref:hypothetical protein n=1 Tax=Nostoc sp. DedSLP03 TaxID=3075400 RepID=UPI002AD44B2A|nr:hypothetical protein [Nostoc sp. DedSLP03]MDZ7964622.1 hypothetical protein [Nostoc sp. DedSLP03]
MQKAQKPLSSAPEAPLLPCPFNDKSLTGHDITRCLRRAIRRRQWHFLLDYPCVSVAIPTNTIDQCYTILVGIILVMI